MPTVKSPNPGVKMYKTPLHKPPREDLRKRRIEAPEEKARKERDRRVRQGLPVGRVKPKRDDDEKEDAETEDEVTLEELVELDEEGKISAKIDPKTGLIEDVPHDKADFFVDRSKAHLEVRRFMEANELTEEDIHELVKVARGQMNEHLKKYSPPVALANALDYAIWSHKQGTYQSKVNAQLYGFILELLARETGHWRDDLLKIAGHGKPRLEQYVARKQDIQERITKVEEELGKQKDAYTKKWLSLQAEKKALGEMERRVSDEVLKITSPEGYQQELFKRQADEMLEKSGAARGRMGYKVWGVGFEQGRPVFGMRVYTILDGMTDKRIEVDTTRKITKALWKELLEDSGKNMKQAVDKVRGALRYYELVSEQKVKLGRVEGPYVLVTADFKLAGREICTNPVRRRQLRTELEAVLSLLSTLLGGGGRRW